MTRRTKNWLPIYIMLGLMAYLVITKSSFGTIVFTSVIVFFNVLLAMADDHMEERMDEDVRKAILAGKAPGLKYEATELLQKAEQILLDDPKNFRAFMVKRVASSRLERFDRLEKELKEESSE